MSPDGWDGIEEGFRGLAGGPVLSVPFGAEGSLELLGVYIVSFIEWVENGLHKQSQA